MNTNKIATGSVNKKLLAALAVLAVAFVVLAAVPAVADSDSDAATPSYANGFIAAAAIADASTADSVYDAVAGTTDKTVPKNSVFAIFHTDGSGEVSYKITISNASGSVVGTRSYTAAELGYGTTAGNYSIIASTEAMDGSINETAEWFSFNSSYTYAYELTIGSDVYTIEIKPGQLNFYQSRDLSSVSSTQTATISSNLTVQGVIDDDSSALEKKTTPALTNLKFKLANETMNVTFKDLTFKDDSSNGRSFITDSSVDYTVAANQKKVNVTIDGVTFQTSTSKATNMVLLRTAGTVTVTDSVFKDTSAANTKVAYDHALTVDGPSTVVLTGNTFDGFTRAVHLDGVKSVSTEGNTLNMYFPASQTDGTANDGAQAYTISSHSSNNYKFQTTVQAGIINSAVFSGDVVTFNGAQVSGATNEYTVSLGSSIKQIGRLVSDIDVALAKSSTTLSDNVDVTIAGSATITGGATLRIDGSKNAELGQGATLTIGEGSQLLIASENPGDYVTGATATSATKLTLDANSSIVLASGASMKVTKVAQIAFATPGNGQTQGTISKDASAVVAVEKDNTTMTAALRSYSPVVLYTITNELTEAARADSSSPTYVAIGVEQYAYAGEKVVMTATPSENYKIDGVYVSATTSDGPNVPAIYDRTDGTYYITMPAYSISTGANVSGAYSASFVLVYKDTSKTSSYTLISGLGPETDANDTTVKSDIKPTFSVPSDPVVAGYSFAGWYTDAACTAKAGSSDYTIASTSTSSVYSSKTIYGLLLVAYDVVVSETTNGTVASSPASAVQGGSVTLTITPAEDYDLTALTVDGKKVTSRTTPTTSPSIGTKAASYTYTFTMPAHVVSVSAVFSELFEITVVNDTTTTPSQGSIAELVTPDDKYVAGATAKITVTPETNYGIQKVIIADADGKELSDVEATIKTTPVYDATNTSTITGYTVTFTMPAQDVTVSATYAQTRDVTLTGDAQVTVAAATWKTTSSTTTATATLTIGAQVQVTITPADKYGVKSLYINGDAENNLASQIVWADGVGTYTYTVPTESEANGASITVASGLLYAITVTQKGSGNVVQPIPESAVGGTDVAFSVLTDSADVSLNQITVKYTLGGTSYTVYYPASAGTSTAGVTAKIVYANGIAILTMPDAAVSIEFGFGDTIYYYVTVSDADHVKLYKTYEDGKLSDELTYVDGSYKVVADTYYIGITNQDGQDIKNASAYKNVPARGSGSSAVAAHTESVVITNLALSDTSAVYSIAVGPSTTGSADKTVAITANYTEHQSTVTFEQPDNGTIAITVDGTAIKSGDKVAYGKELSITVTPSATATGYVVTGVKANDKTLASTEGVYTADVGMDDIVVSASLAQGYSITYEKVSGVTITGATGAVADDTVVLTVEVDSAYTLDSVSYAYNDQAATTLVAAADGTYSFTMPAYAVTVSAKATLTSEVPVAAKNVEVGVMGVSNGSARVVVHSLDEGCYVPAGTVTVTFTYANALGIDVTVSAQASYAGTNTSAEYATVLVTLPAAVASAISSGSDVVAHATYAITDGASFDSIVVSLKGATA